MLERMRLVLVLGLGLVEGMVYGLLIFSTTIFLV